MPYISITTSKSLGRERKDALKAALGSIISLIPRKDESKLMLSVSDGVSMYFRGEEKDCAYVEVKLFGAAPLPDKERFAAEACRAVGQAFGIPAGDIFLTFHEFQSWGSNGALNTRQ